MQFKDRTVLITGASGNLGQAVASVFSTRGANLVLIDVKGKALHEKFKGDAERHLLLAVDLLSQQQVDTAVNQAIERFRRIDVLANIAGGFRMGDPVHATSDGTWNFLFDINVRTMLNMTHAVVPRMLEHGGGKIVNVGAFSAQKGVAQMGAYVAAKSAVIRLTESLSAEVRDQNINVNCVLPTTIDTPENRASMPKADPKRWVVPEDLANVIVFLASDDARAIHGAALPVTGLS